MKTIKAEPVVSTAVVNKVRVSGLATNLEGRDDYPHFIPWSEMKGEDLISKTKWYVDIVSKNHPEYTFVPDEVDAQPSVTIMTPKVEEAVHPHKAELDKAFGVDEVEFNKPPVASNVDLDTGEVTEDPQETIKEPLKQETMENKTEAPKSKVSLKRKAKWYGAVGLGLAVRTVTVPTHVTLQTAADILQASANGVRNVEASAINALKLSTATKDEIKGRIDQRTARIESIMAMPVTVPFGIVKSIKSSISSARESRTVNVQTA